MKIDYAFFITMTAPEVRYYRLNDDKSFILNDLKFSSSEGHIRFVEAIKDDNKGFLVDFHWILGKTDTFLMIKSIDTKHTLLSIQVSGELSGRTTFCEEPYKKPEVSLIPTMWDAFTERYF